MSDVIDLTNDSSDYDTGSADGNDHEQQGPQLDDISRTQLHVAIATVPDRTLREIVANLVDANRAVESAIFRELVTLSPAVNARGAGPAVGAPPPPAARERSRELVPKWQVCENCGEQFDAGEEATDDECSYHPGDLEVDEEMFVDWDEDCHGPMDSRENRDRYPENFTWSCCEGHGLADGCERRRHTTERPVKRRRY